jgi:uncharacterized membrane protein YdjX (TVP38/TMEM64 family)
MLPAACSGENKGKAICLCILLVIVMFGVFACVITLFGYLMFSGDLLVFLDWVQNVGYWGNVIMGIVLALLNLPFTMGYVFVVMVCGFFYGFWIGTFTVVIGSFFGWLLSFLIMRYVFKSRAEQVSL